MKRSSEVFKSFILLCSIVLVCGDLALDGPKCGQKFCKRDEYCSEYHGFCEACSKICNDTTHNFDKELCVKSCQGYIHDTRYALKNEIGAGDGGNLQGTVQRLTHLVNVTLILVCFTLAILAIVLSIQFYKWKKKNNITLNSIKSKLFTKKSEPVQDKPIGLGNQESKTKPDLRLEIPDESTHSGNSPGTMTTSISRRPAEDSTLDYAYDNPAMSSSPNKKTSPPSF